MVDLPATLNEGTILALYAGDTKIWRSIKFDMNHTTQQLDIEFLN